MRALPVSTQIFADSHPDVDDRPVPTEEAPTPRPRAGGRRLVAMHMPPARTGEMIAALMPLLRHGRRLFCLDGANVFDPYRLAEQARLESVEPGRVLDRVLISRAYTCHQLLGGVESLLAGLANDPMGARVAGHADPSADSESPPLALLLGVDRLFLDEDLPQHERAYLFGAIVRRAAELRADGLALAVTYVGPDHTPWVRTLARHARLVRDPRQALALVAESTTRTLIPRAV